MGVTGLEEIYKIAVQVLEQKSLCQQDPDQEENDDDAPENAAEYDSVLISSAGDLVSSLANVMGVDFVQLFDKFYPLISKYYVSLLSYYICCFYVINVSILQRKDRSLSDRSSAIGCLAEVIAGMKAAITPSTEPLLELFYRALSDLEPEVRSNAAFAAGLLVENSTVDLSPQYLHLLQALQPFFLIGPDASAAELNARDNAAGAVARLILRNTSAVPLEQVLPALIEVLPLKADLLENRPVFRSLFHLFRSSPQSLYPHMDKLLAVFAHVLDPNAGDQIPEETRNELIELISFLNREDPAKIQAAGLAPYIQGA
jgi:importin-4